MTPAAHPHRAIGLLVLLLLTAPTLAQPDPTEPQVAPPRRVLLNAVESREWIFRAIAAMRLERPGEAHAELLLDRLLADKDWRVRAFAVRTIARRPDGAARLDALTETDPRVLRVAMLYGARPDPERLRKRLGLELRARALDRKVTAIELAALSGDPVSLRVMADALERLIPRLSAVDAGYLSWRLGPACGLPTTATADDWARWIDATFVAEGNAVRPAPRTPAPSPRSDATTDGAPLPLAIASLDDEQFVRFMEDYISELKAQPVDLVICLDCTGSMRRTLESAKSGTSQLIRFLTDVSSRLRVGLVTYTGHLAELQHLSLTGRPQEIQTFLWATGLGSGSRETVLAALRAGVENNRFASRALSVVVLIGDEPYQPASREKLESLVRGAAEDGVVVSTVNALVRAPGASESPPLPAWDEIAAWGGGRSVHLEDPGDLITLLITLTIGKGWQEEVQDLISTYFECVP